MIGIEEFEVCWDTIRDKIPNDDAKYEVLKALVEMLLEDGWDQHGYLYELEEGRPEIQLLLKSHPDVFSDEVP